MEKKTKNLDSTAVHAFQVEAKTVCPTSENKIKRKREKKKNID